MKTINYVITDEKRKTITGAVEVLDGSTKEITINALCEDVSKIFSDSDIETVIIRAKANSETSDVISNEIYIDKRSSEIDDAHITYANYIYRQCAAIVTAMRRRMGVWD